MNPSRENETPSVYIWEPSYDLEPDLKPSPPNLQPGIILLPNLTSFHDDLIVEFDILSILEKNNYFKLIKNSGPFKTWLTDPI